MLRCRRVGAFYLHLVLIYWPLLHVPPRQILAVRTLAQSRAVPPIHFCLWMNQLRRRHPLVSRLRVHWLLVHGLRVGVRERRLIPLNCPLRRQLHHVGRDFWVLTLRDRTRQEAFDVDGGLCWAWI